MLHGIWERHGAAEPDPAAISTLIAALPNRLPQGATLADVLAALEDRALGAVLAAVALPAIVPTPGIPAGMVFGTVLAMIAVQATFGATQPALPKRLAQRKVSRKILGVLARRGPRLLHPIERILKPRLTWLAGPTALQRLGPVLFVLGVLVPLPIPFGNTLPGLATLMIGLGTASRDGLAVLAGLLLAAAAALVSVGLVLGAWRLVGSVLPAR